MGWFGNDKEDKDKLPCGCTYYSCCPNCCSNWDSNKKHEEIPECSDCHNGSNKNK
jgi:hypothetical protein